MAPARLASVLLALLLVGIRHASAQIRIMSPQDLVNTVGNHGKIRGSTATFGAPYFGQRVLGRLIYPAENGTAPHCTKEDYGQDLCGMEKEGANAPAEFGEARLINIFVLRRGGCSFVKKVKVAESKCAHAVIIVDRKNSNYTAADLQHIIVADDGYGDKIQIPSVLIDKVVGQKLIDYVKNDQTQVVGELAWDIPADDFVNVDMWISSASRESQRFLKEFAPKRRVLNSVINFTPHYAVFGMDSGSPQIYNDLCTDNTGKYCGEDPDGAGPIKGVDVLEEDVRQLCIHEIYKKVSNEGRVQFSTEFWDYIELLGDTCPLDGDTAETRFGFECSHALMKKVHIDTSLIDNCASSTRDAKLSEQRKKPAWSARALRINSWRYTGMLDTDLVIRAICAGFIKMPDECNTLLTPRDPLAAFNNINAKGGVSFGEMIGWLLFTLVLAFLALLLYKRYLKKEMRVTLREEVMLEVRNAMGEYRQMQG